ncbi:MAG TPA: hypothetical protein VMM36_02290 [Opitutaceae bacterium]|nr:hypothetical protein [Opitutaceae bacterium]
MTRNILSTLAGLLVAVAFVFLIELISHRIWPPPAAISDMSDKEALRNAVAAMPFGSLASVALAWIAGAFSGGFVAAKLSRKAVPAWIVGGFIALSGIGNLMMIPHPFWFWIVAIVLVPAVTLAAARLGAPRVPASP